MERFPKTIARWQALDYKLTVMEHDPNTSANVYGRIRNLRHKLQAHFEWKMRLEADGEFCLTCDCYKEECNCE